MSNLRMDRTAGDDHLDQWELMNTSGLDVLITVIDERLFLTLRRGFATIVFDPDKAQVTMGNPNLRGPARG